MSNGQRIASLWAFWFAEPIANYSLDGNGGLCFNGWTHNVHGLAAPKAGGR